VVLEDKLGNLSAARQTMAMYSTVLHTSNMLEVIQRYISHSHLFDVNSISHRLGSLAWKKGISCRVDYLSTRASHHSQPGHWYQMDIRCSFFRLYPTVTCFLIWHL